MSGKFQVPGAERIAVRRFLFAAFDSFTIRNVALLYPAH